MRIICLFVIVALLFSSCHQDIGKRIVGYWKQVYNKPTTFALKGYKTLAFYNNNTGTMQLYDRSLKLRLSINFTYKVIENRSVLELTHLSDNYSGKDSIIEDWTIKSIDSNTLTIAGDYVDLNYQRLIN